MVSPQPKTRALLATVLALTLVVAMLWLTRSSRSPQQPPNTPAPTAFSTEPLTAPEPTEPVSPGAGSTTDLVTEATETSSPIPSVPMPSELPGPAQRTAWVPTPEATRQVTYLVSTNGPAQVVHGSIGGDQTTAEVTDDWRLDVELPDADSTVRVWVTSTGAADLACEILIDGTSVVSRSGYGTPPQAICAANLQFSG